MVLLVRLVDVVLHANTRCHRTIKGSYQFQCFGNGGPTIFTVYSGTGADRQQIGWGEMKGGEGRFYTNYTDQPVLASVTMHEDAPTDRCGTQHEQGFLDVRS